MPPEGRAVHEHRGVVLERRAHLVVDDNPAHRQVARRYAFGEARHIREHVESLDTEPLAEPAEGTDDGVGDQKDTVFVTDLTHPLPVIRRRHEAPSGVLYGLQDDGGDRLRRAELDGLLDGVGSSFRVLLRIRYVVEALEQWLEGSLERRQPRHGECAHGGAVVGDLARDNLVALGLATGLVVLPGQLDDRLDGLGARGDEEGGVEVSRSYPGDPGRKLQAPRMVHAPVGEEPELLHLLRSDLGELAPPVPDLRREEPGKPVYVSLALVVGDVATLAGDDDRQLRPVLGMRREMEHQVLHTSERRVVPALLETPHNVHVIPPPGRATQLFTLHEYYTVTVIWSRSQRAWRDPYPSFCRVIVAGIARIEASLGSKKKAGITDPGPLHYVCV